MKHDPKAKTPPARRTQAATAAALVVGLSATGAVYFSLSGAHAATAVSDNRSDTASARGQNDLGRHVPRTVERDLRVRRKDIRVRRDGIEFVSRDYAEALNTDRTSVVRALSRKYPWIDIDRIIVRGTRIFIGGGGDGGPQAIFENLCLHITLNICKKD